jgi:GDP-fucose protein O-fucosyltransferase
MFEELRGSGSRGDPSSLELRLESHSSPQNKNNHSMARHVSSYFYDIIEQLVCANAETFIGTYYSTFTGYINRLRGYHSTANILSSSSSYWYRKNPPAVQRANENDGSINSYYYAADSQQDRRTIMKNYTAIQPWYWIREYPIAWRDIDHDIIYES